MHPEPRPEPDDVAPHPASAFVGLSVREHMALAVEASTWKYLGAKETYIRENLGWSPVRHAQVVNALIDRPDANAAYPMLCSRLRRLRERRKTRRTAPATLD